MLVVVVLRLLLRDFDITTHLAANDLLRDDVIADVLLKILE